MKIATKDGLPEENAVVKIVDDLLQRYDVPKITDHVVVQHKAIPHSHPILTLNTRTNDPLVILKTLIHEQIHWWTQGREEYDECILYLKKHYKDNGECNRSGKYPNSFWEHIIVCFNTRKILKALVTQDEVDHIYTQWQPYPKTEELVKENYERVHEELRRFAMVYR